MQIPHGAGRPHEESDDYVLTLYEVRELLGKSTRTLSRYVQKHILHPRSVKSCQGTLEYRFSRREVYDLRESEKNLRPYLFGAAGETSELPNYAQANFATYNCPPSLVQSPQTPYLVPGVSFPLGQNQFPQTAPQNFYPAPAVQNFDPRILEMPDREKRPKAESRKRENLKPEKEPVKEQVKEHQNRADGEIISLLKETTEMLRGQLKTKDDQIKNLDDKIGQLIERNRETNILLKGLQDKIMLLEQPKNKRENRDRAETKIAGAVSAANKEFQEDQILQRGSEVPAQPSRSEVENTASCALPVPPVRPVSDKNNSKKQDNSGGKGLFGKFFG